MSIVENDYNVIAEDNNWPKVDFSHSTGTFIFPCTIKYFLTENFGKWPVWETDDMIVFEYKNFLKTIADYLPGAYGQN